MTSTVPARHHPIFIHHASFKINHWSDLSSFKPILKREARVNFLERKVDPITPMHKIISRVSVVRRTVSVTPQGAHRPDFQNQALAFTPATSPTTFLSPSASCPCSERPATQNQLITLKTSFRLTFFCLDFPLPRTFFPFLSSKGWIQKKWVAVVVLVFFLEARDPD